MSIFKRGKVCWYKFKWSMKSVEGETEHFEIRRSAHTRNARKASEVEEEHRRAIRLGLVHPIDPWPRVLAPEAPTVAQFAKRFQQHNEHHTKPGTVRFYKTSLSRVLNFSPLASVVMSPHLGDVISRYSQWRKCQAKNCTITINGDLRTLRRMFRLAVEWGVLDKAPVIHELSGEERRERVISHAEEAKYLSVASTTVRDVAILTVDAGLRHDSEVLVLRWDGVQLQPMPDAPGGAVLIPDGKTENAVRKVPLTPRAHDVLLRRWHMRGSSQFVFPGRGRTGHLTTVQHAHERAIKRAAKTVNAKRGYNQGYRTRETARKSK